MIVSKQGGRIDVKILEQHLREMPDGDYAVELTPLTTPTRRQNAYLFGHLAKLAQEHFKASGIPVSKESAINIFRKSLGYSEMIINFDESFEGYDVQNFIEALFFELLDLGYKPVHPRDYVK